MTIYIPYRPLILLEVYIGMPHIYLHICIYTQADDCITYFNINESCLPSNCADRFHCRLHHHPHSPSPAPSPLKHLYHTIRVCRMLSFLYRIPKHLARGSESKRKPLLVQMLRTVNNLSFIQV